MEGGGGWVWWEGNRRREGKGGCDGKGVGGGGEGGCGGKGVGGGRKIMGVVGRE